MAKASKTTTDDHATANPAEPVAFKTDNRVIAGYRITAMIDGFRRAGRAHYGAKIYRADELNDIEISMLENEPMLVVERLEELPDAYLANNQED